MSGFEAEGPEIFAPPHEKCHPIGPCPPASLPRSVGPGGQPGLRLNISRDIYYDLIDPSPLTASDGPAMQICLGLLVLLGSPALLCAQAPISATLLARLDSAITRDAQAGFSGVVLVAHGDSILFEKGYGPAGRIGPPRVRARILAGI